MIDHVTIRVSDFDASKRFYTTVLEPLGRGLDWEDSDVRFAEWGDFSIAHDGKPLSRDLHVAFAARSRSEVDAFHRTALEAGYRDNGAPDERPQYHPGYYAAYVFDPDGNNVEAVFHDRPAA
jgi:catechol 2,3-dioxygenase-like lactoylglutathione lyase family enzyme